MKKPSFTAVDFETATPDRMACQVGLTIVRNGEIKDTIVKLIKPPKYMFPYEYELENGEKTTGSIERTAIMKEMPEFGIYTVYSTEKNGTERYYARKLDVVTGQEKDDFIEVISGIGYMDRIIENVDENITDNCEVIIIG